MSTTSTLNPNGQVTIPEGIRQRLELQAGVRLRFEVDASGTILLRPEPEPTAPRSRLPGLLRHLVGPRPVSIEEMKQAVADEAGERFRRSTRR